MVATRNRTGCQKGWGWALLLFIINHFKVHAYNALIKKLKGKLKWVKIKREGIVNRICFLRKQVMSLRTWKKTALPL